MVEMETHCSTSAFGQAPGQRPANYLLIFRWENAMVGPGPGGGQAEAGFSSSPAQGPQTFFCRLTLFFLRATVRAQGSAVLPPASAWCL